MCWLGWGVRRRVDKDLCKPFSSAVSIYLACRLYRKAQHRAMMTLVSSRPCAPW